MQNNDSCISKKEFYSTISSVFVFIWVVLLVSRGEGRGWGWLCVFLIAIAAQLYYGYKAAKAGPIRSETNNQTNQPLQ